MRSFARSRSAVTARSMSAVRAARSWRPSWAPPKNAARASSTSPDRADANASHTPGSGDAPRHLSVCVVASGGGDGEPARSCWLKPRSPASPSRAAGTATAPVSGGCGPRTARPGRFASVRVQPADREGGPVPPRVRACDRRPLRGRADPRPPLGLRTARDAVDPGLASRHRGRTRCSGWTDSEALRPRWKPA